jgi:integrase
VKGKNFAAITDPKRVGALLRAIAGYQGQPTVMAALELAPLVFVRPGELRGAEWTEFDLDEAVWRIPGGRMKKNIETEELPAYCAVALASHVADAHLCVVVGEC